MDIQPPRYFGYIQPDHLRMAYHNVVSLLGRQNDTQQFDDLDCALSSPSAWANVQKYGDF
jgi:hypothetical protein